MVIITHNNQRFNNNRKKPKEVVNELLESQLEIKCQLKAIITTKNHDQRSIILMELEDYEAKATGIVRVAKTDR